MNYYNDPSVNVNNVSVKYNSDNNTAVAAANIQAENTQPTQIYVLLQKDASGNYQPKGTVTKDKADQILAQGGQTTSQPTSQAQTQQGQSTSQTATQANTCTGTSGNVIYQADWSSGMNGWTGSSDWKHVDSMVSSDGSPGHPTTEERLLAPCQPPTQDYALEAKIQLLNTQCGTTYNEFGLVARETDQGGIIGGVACDQAKLAIIQNAEYFNFGLRDIGAESFSPGTSLHTYRLEVQGNQLRFLVDGTPVVEKTNNSILSGSKVGMFSVGAQINVQSFKIGKL